jgi:hypothetical protein
MTEPRDRDTVVVTDRDGGSGLGMILGILLVLALLIAVWYFTLGPGRGTTNSGGTTNPVPSVQAPATSQAPAASPAAS